MFVLDSHCDTPSQIYRMRDIGKEDAHAQVDFPKLRRGGVDAAFFAAYVPNSLAPDAATRYALELIACTRDAVAANSAVAALATSVEEALRNKVEGKTSVFLALENGSPIQKNLGILRLFYELGVRYMTLTHARDNEICDSCTSGGSGRWGGLSAFGREVVAEMNRLGMLVDVSHISDRSFYDVLECSSKPVVATHSCCRALADRPRNMTDDMILRLAGNGGVIQINFYPAFLDADFASVLDRYDDAVDRIEGEFIADPADATKRAAWYGCLDRLKKLPRPDYRRVADHIDHVVSLVGPEHVGIGSDFDGIAVTPEGLENCSRIGVIFEELRRRGYDEASISAIAGGNFLRVLGAGNGGDDFRPSEKGFGAQICEKTSINFPY